MLKYRLNFEYYDFIDSIEVTGENIEEIQKKAEAELKRRGNPSNYWSEEIKS